MILTTHIIVGSAIATPLIQTGHPVIGVIAGLASHYALDIIPHWSYRLDSIENKSQKESRRFSRDIASTAFDIAKTGIDFFFGLILVGVIATLAGNNSFPLILAGIAGALPDGLLGLQLLYKGLPMPQLQKFHDYFHFDNGGENDLPFTWKRFGFQFALICASLLIISIV